MAATLLTIWLTTGDSNIYPSATLNNIFGIQNFIKSTESLEILHSIAVNITQYFLYAKYLLE